jgi:hypothetical protein
MFAPKILLFAAAAWLLVVCIRRRKPGFSALTALGVGTIIAGLAVFGMRSSRHEDGDVVVVSPRIHHAAFDHAAVEKGDFVKIAPPRPEVQFHRGFPFDSDGGFDGDFDGPPKWMIISMGTLLVIAGSLLAGRERTRPAAMKAFTLLGVGAIVYSVVSFFGSAPRITSARDRVVRVSQVSERNPAPPPIEHQAKRTSRAKRPASRPERPAREHEEPLAETLPPRAGEIPVSAEVSESEPKAEAIATSVAAAPAQPKPPVAEAPSSAPPAPPAPPAAEPPVGATPAGAPVAATEKPAAAPDATAVATVSPVAPEQVAKDKPAETKPAETLPTTTKAPQPPDPPALRRSAGRPEWVDAPAKLSNSVYTISISSGLFVSVPECQREINAHMKRAVDHYVDEYRGDHASTLVSLPLAYLNEHVKKAEYSEVVNASVGPMHQIHALLEIDDRTRADIDRQWHNAVVTDRLWYTGSGAALVLALLGTFYGYLRLDLRTGGAQKGRLQLAATLVALIVAAGALLARWAVPF